MKVYERNESVDFEYPDEMVEILDYLNKHGKILVKPLAIESLYFHFSDEQYCASWMIVDEELLKVLFSGSKAEERQQSNAFQAHIMISKIMATQIRNGNLGVMRQMLGKERDFLDT